VLDEATDGATNDATGGSTSGLQPAWGLSAR